jgi:capsule polysaccharide export protein KpsE/RkpR
MADQPEQKSSYEKLKEYCTFKNCCIVVVIVVILVVLFYYVEPMVVNHVYSGGASQRFATEQTATNQGPPGSVSQLVMEARHLQDLRNESRELMESAEPDLTQTDKIRIALRENRLLDPQGHSAQEILLQQQLYTQ